MIVRTHFGVRFGVDGGVAATRQTCAPSRAGCSTLIFSYECYGASLCQRVDGKEDIQTNIVRSTIQQLGIRAIVVPTLLESRISSKSDDRVKNRDAFLIRYRRVVNWRPIHF